MANYNVSLDQIHQEQQDRLINYMTKNKLKHDMEALHLTFDNRRSSTLVQLNIGAMNNNITPEQDQKLIDFLDANGMLLISVSTNKIRDQGSKRLIYYNQNKYTITESNQAYLGYGEGIYTFTSFNQPIKFFTQNRWGFKSYMTVAPKQCKKVVYIDDVIGEVLTCFEHSRCLRRCFELKVDVNPLGGDFPYYPQRRVEMWEKELIKSPITMITTFESKKTGILCHSIAENRLRKILREKE